MHLVVFETSGGESRSFPMNAGLTATEMGNALIAAGSEFGLSADYDRSKFENDDPRPYDEGDASGAVRRSRGCRRGAHDPAKPSRGARRPDPTVAPWIRSRLRVVRYANGRLPQRAGSQAISRRRSIWVSIRLVTPTSTPIRGRSRPTFCSMWTFPAVPNGTPKGGKDRSCRTRDVAGSPDGVDRFLAYAEAVFDAAAPTLTA